MADRFPDYDVLAKRGTPSWNAPTRAAVDARLALAECDPGLGAARIATLRRVAERVVPQPEGRAPVNIVALMLARIGGAVPDGYRHAALPPILPAWRTALDALDREARARHVQSFAALNAERADALLRRVEDGSADRDHWQNVDPQLFWHWRLLPDLVASYWAHPSAWSAMGFGGPASPRGYVRLGADRADPWEARERKKVRADA